jgi:GSH-dependent disulfide-bond oxidoreductase
MKNKTSKVPSIQVYSWATPNGHKVHIMLEECGFKLGKDWEANPVDIGKGDQFKPEFLSISPNNRIPALVDMNGPDGKPISVFESGAILLYLASKTGKFLPKKTTDKFKVMEWLMFQMGGVGPMLGQNHHFRLYAPEKIEYAVNRYTKEANRLYGVMDRQLAKNPYIAGKTYSIADIAIYPWLRNWKNQGVEMSDYPHLQKWFNAIDQRPAVMRGVEVLTALRKPLHDAQAKDILFGIKEDEKK